MKAEDLKELLMSGDYDEWSVEKFTSHIRELEASTDKILKNIKEKQDETVKPNR